MHYSKDEMCKLPSNYYCAIIIIEGVTSVHSSTNSIYKNARSAGSIMLC